MQRIAIIQFPGSNCERETGLAVKRVGMEPVEYLWNEPHEKLRALDGYIIVGGFSYEDRSRAGIIAALDPVLQVIKEEAALGKPVLGICNGAQILVESGMVPGLENNKLALSLTENKRMLDEKILGTGYYNAWIHMRVSDDYQRNAFTKHVTPKSVLHVPVAHAEGRFVISPALLSEIRAQGLNVFQYADKHGNVLEGFPTNPNGSIDNIAAISNKAGNVMAMMPHPERTTNGDAIFASMRDYIAEKKAPTAIPLYYYPRQQKLNLYAKQNAELLVELFITDNHALTVENTLRQMGFPVRVKRYTHWEVSADVETLKQIKHSEVLFNPRKESEVVGKLTNAYLVRPKEDLLGMEKKQLLEDHYNIQGLNEIKAGIVWQFLIEKDTIGALAQETLEGILKTNIICNPYSHDCYQYR